MVKRWDIIVLELYLLERDELRWWVLWWGGGGGGEGERGVWYNRTERKEGEQVTEGGVWTWGAGYHSVYHPFKNSACYKILSKKRCLCCQ